uniref:MEDS domain-containing protein n=1 Tax=Caenorhabditis tropicalis TaxID=1561998 RepID=A0A1I7TKL1_9PELO
MVTPHKPDFKSKWAMVVTVNDLNDSKRDDLKDFGEWFIETLRLEGAFIGHYFNYEKTPVTIVETVPNNFESCTNAYQKIHKEHPQVVLVVHILPQTQSHEYEWMKVLASRYGFVRQGILYENCVNRFENVDTDQNSIFRNMCQWIYRSGTAIVRNEGNSCGILHGKEAKPTFEKVLFNSEDIKDAVFKVLHREQDPRGAEMENIVKVSGYPEMLNAFGIAQLLSPYRVNGVSITGSQSAVVTLENKFHVYQAVQEFNGKNIDRNHKLEVVSNVISSPAVPVEGSPSFESKQHIANLMGKLKVSS